MRPGELATCVPPSNHLAARCHCCSDLSLDTAVDRANTKLIPDTTDRNTYTETFFAKVFFGFFFF